MVAGCWALLPQIQSFSRAKLQIQIALYYFPSISLVLWSCGARNMCLCAVTVKTDPLSLYLAFSFTIHLYLHPKHFPTSLLVFRCSCIRDCPACVWIRLYVYLCVFVCVSISFTVHAYTLNPINSIVSSDLERTTFAKLW